MIEITPSIRLGEDELTEKFVRAGGPGGQHVNTSSTAVELRFDALGSPSLPEDLKARLRALAGGRMTGEGVIVIFAQTHRSQEMNRQEARGRLVELLRAAAVRPKRRKPTRPTLASKLRRREGKARRSGVKALRGRPADD